MPYDLARQPAERLSAPGNGQVIGLLQIRNAVALAGVVELRQLSRQLNIPPGLLEAMLEQLVVLGSVEWVMEPIKNSCQGCLGCSAVQSCPREYYYRYVQS